MRTFYRTVKLWKEYLEETNENAALIEKQIQLNMDFKKWKMKNKKWTSNHDKNDHTLLKYWSYSRRIRAENWKSKTATIS